MPDQNYPAVEPDDAAEPTEPTADNETPGKDAAKGDQADGETSLLPSSFFGGDAKVGDKCEVEIVGIHSGEVEVKYAKEPMSKDRQSEMEDAMNAGFASKSKAE